MIRPKGREGRPRLVHCLGPTSLCPSGAERAGVRWGIAERRSLTTIPQGVATAMPRARAPAAMLRSKVTSVAPTRREIAMWIASGVRRLTSRRRKIRFAASISVVVISSRYADRATHVSRLENASCPSSRVRSRVRTRRPTADENSATPKSLTTTVSGCADKKASARALDGSMTNSATRTLASK